jgi:hypothetical protein
MLHQAANIHRDDSILELPHPGLVEGKIVERTLNLTLHRIKLLFPAGVGLKSVSDNTISFSLGETSSSQSNITLSSILQLYSNLITYFVAFLRILRL